MLDAAYRALQTQVHPDRFAGGTDSERRLALQSSARVNEAYRALKDPVQRAQYLLRLHGVESVGETDTQLPLEFLEQQLERREAAADAHAAGDVRTLVAMIDACAPMPHASKTGWRRCSTASMPMRRRASRYASSRSSRNWPTTWTTSSRRSIL